MALPIVHPESFSRISRTVFREERTPPPVKPRKRQRPDPLAGGDGVTEGYTGIVVVITDIFVDTNNCITGWETTALEFEDGLLKAVT